MGFKDPRLFGIQRHNDAEVMSGLYDAIERLVPDREESSRLREQLRAYRMEEGIFGKASSIEDRIKIPPGRWWQFYGAETPELQHFANRVLAKDQVPLLVKGIGVALITCKPRKETGYSLQGWKTWFMCVAIYNWP